MSSQGLSLSEEFERIRRLSFATGKPFMEVLNTIGSSRMKSIFESQTRSDEYVYPVCGQITKGNK